MNKSYNALLVQRASINFYPPTINQANLLAESGLKVAILDGGSGPKPTDLHSEVTLIRPLENGVGIVPVVDQSLPSRLLDNIRFMRVLRQSQCMASISVRIGYDSPAIAALGRKDFSGFTICHFHDYPEPLGEGWMADRRNKLARQFSRKADMIIMPDQHRCMAFQMEEKLRKQPQTVRNCPRKLSNLPSGNLRPLLNEREQGSKRIVLFQGAISKNYYADKIIESIPWWPHDSVMVFIGPVKKALQDELDYMVRQLGITNRVIFLPQQPYSELFSYTVDADLAFGLIRPISFNFAHMAGASNKRYEYMACGIPQITNRGPGMEELIEQSGVGLCVNPDTPEEIGRQVSHLLADKRLRQEMGNKARRLHLEQYNYEVQFAPVLEKIVVAASHMKHISL